jgi:hypothetical protein
MTYPSWVVLHVPHDSTVVPADVRAQFLLAEAELSCELTRMTDHQTLAIFADPSSDAAVVRSPVSRLLVDVERFPSDADEPMAARGMGAVYTTTSQLTPLRRRLSGNQREPLMQAYYRPHHTSLKACRDGDDRATRANLGDRTPPGTAANDKYTTERRTTPSARRRSWEAPVNSPLVWKSSLPVQMSGLVCGRLAMSIATASRARRYPTALATNGYAQTSSALHWQPVLVRRKGQRRHGGGQPAALPLQVCEEDATPLADFERVARRIRETCVEALTSCCL